MWASGSTGSWSCASVHDAPPSVDTSTRCTLPLPDHASPEIWWNPGPSSRCPPDGRVMTDLASITNVNCRASPLGIRSVYFEVSSRVCQARSTSCIRRSHLMEMLPSHPGISSRSGYPWAGRSASPFWPQATRVSSIALSRGTLRVMRHASAPSATSQPASGRTPASPSSTDSGTPVHSLQLVMPNAPWASVSGWAGDHFTRPLPEHSMKYTRLTAGSLRSSAIVNTSGRSTRPPMASRCSAGSMSGMPAWCRSKCSSDGVRLPSRSWSGVRLPAAWS